MSKIFQFFKDVKAELFKVIWPTRAEALRYTITVILFSISVALILGAVDLGLLRAFEAILNK